MKLLLHACCGPCSVYPLEMLKNENIEVEGFFFNPNIHPYMEYKARLETAKKFYQDQNIDFVEFGGYGLEDFLKKAVFAESRCAECYYTRLDKTASEAKRRGADAFSTTLLVSPYQKHELIINICKELEKKYEIDFLYRDFREGFRKGNQKARDIGLYMQKYCGCIYSEKERYLK